MKKRKWNVSKFLNPDGVWGASISVLNSYPVGISLGLWPSSALAWWWNSAQEKSTFHQEVFFKGFLISGFSWNVYFLTNPPEKLLEPKMAFKFGNIILGQGEWGEWIITILKSLDFWIILLWNWQAGAIYDIVAPLYSGQIVSLIANNVTVV